jgi:hypothetical protein
MEMNGRWLFEGEKVLYRRADYLTVAHLEGLRDATTACVRRIWRDDCQEM